MRREQAYLRHILDEIDFLLKETAGIEREEFLDNGVLKRACARSLEVIGEATKNIPDDYRLLHPEVEWRKLAGMRDKIIHYYFGVNWDIVWDVIRNSLPELRTKVELLLRETDAGQ